MPFNGGNIVKVNRRITADIKKELRQQGHYLTGALEQSIIEKETLTQSDIIIEAFGFAYIQDLEQGIPAEKIVINVNSLSEMTKYVELRMGYKGRNAAKVALRILQKQKIEGNPTEASKRFSKDGERLHAVAKTFERNEAKYFEMIDAEVMLVIDNALSKFTSETI